MPRPLTLARGLGMRLTTALVIIVYLVLVVGSQTFARYVPRDAGVVKCLFQVVQPLGEVDRSCHPQRCR